MDQKEKEKRETPIVDGDARPDMPIAPEDNKERKRGEKTSSADKKFESERLSDINSLEDHKDAKN